jgi:type I restriction enzyme S subunit
MSEDPDFDMDIVEDDELDELGTDDSSLSERRTRTGKKEPVEKADESLDSRSESVGSREEEHTGSSSEKRHTDSDAGARGDNYITGFGSFPSDWEKKGIAECAEIRDSERIPLNSSEREEIQPGNIPYYGANGIVDYVDDYLFDSELILLAEDGGHFEEYEKRPVAYRVSGKAWINNHAHILEAKEGINTEYLFYGLEHRNLVPYVSGSTRSKLTQSMLRKVRVPLPPLPEQRKIASVLYAVDQAIQKTEEIIEQAQRVKRGLMQALLTKGVSEGGKIRNEVENRFRSTDIGRQPQEWKVVYGHEVYNTNPTQYTADGKVDYIEMDALQTDLPNPEYIGSRDPSEYSGQMFASGDVLFAQITPCTENGKAALVPELSSDAGVGSTEFIVLSPDQDKILPGYLYYLVKSHPIHNYAVSRMRGSTGRQRVPVDVFRREIRFGLPPLSEQKKIVDRLFCLDEEIQIERSLRGEYRSLKKSLMQDLLTGEVRTVDKVIEVLGEVKAHG